MRFLKKIRNFILKTITWFSFLIMIFSACSMDCENIVIPIVGLLVSMTWLILFSFANQNRVWYWEHGEV